MNRPPHPYRREIANIETVAGTLSNLGFTYLANQLWQVVADLRARDNRNSTDVQED